jgi:DNA adenine methylase
MFIYLNRTGYNGLFRLNSRGLFNVPRGRYKNPRICDEDNLRRVSSTLSALSATVEQVPFDAVLHAARRGDFVYFDPPYAPLSTTAQFTSYTSDRFGSEDQRHLQQVVIALAAKGCHVLLSNSTAPEIAALYDGNADAERAGLEAHTVPARRAINSNASRRGRILEYIITNVRGKTT